MRPIDVDTQRVNAAVGVAVKRKLRESGKPPEDQRAMAMSIGRRIQGTYGAELRKAASIAPDLSAAELCEAVIWLQEYPWEYAEGSDSAATIYTGQRDKARQRRYGPFLDDHEESMVDAVIWCAGVLAAKAAVGEPVRRERTVECGEPAPQMADLREALAVGTEIGAATRRMRRDRAKGVA